jgi:hypothetical protein
VENSYNKDFTLRAFDCLAVLRKECVAQQKAESFNSWMKKFKEKLLTNRLYNDVWQQIVADGVTLITNDEASDSNVSKEEAEEFLMGTEPHEQLDSGGLAEEELVFATFRGYLPPSSSRWRCYCRWASWTEAFRFISYY